MLSQLSSKQSIYSVNICQELLVSPGQKFILDAFQRLAGHSISTVPAYVLPTAWTIWGDKSLWHLYHRHLQNLLTCSAGWAVVSEQESDVEKIYKLFRIKLNIVIFFFFKCNSNKYVSLTFLDLHSFILHKSKQKVLRRTGKHLQSIFV